LACGDDVDSVALYFECLTRLSKSESYDSTWFPHLVVNAIELRVFEADIASFFDE
jgi:hypothetical protein